MDTSENEPSNVQAKKANVKTNPVTIPIAWLREAERTLGGVRVARGREIVWGLPAVREAPLAAPRSHELVELLGPAPTPLPMTSG